MITSVTAVLAIHRLYYGFKTGAAAGTDKFFDLISGMNNSYNMDILLHSTN